MTCDDIKHLVLHHIVKSFISLLKKCVTIKSDNEGHYSRSVKSYFAISKETIVLNFVPVTLNKKVCHPGLI